MGTSNTIHFDWIRNTNKNKDKVLGGDLNKIETRMELVLNSVLLQRLAALALAL